MIKELFGTPVEPFKRDDLTLLKQQEEIKDILMIHTRQGGLSIIVGDPGTGKSVLREDIETLNDSREYTVASIERTMHTYQTILKQLMDALGLIIEKGRSKEIEQALITEAFKINNQGKKLITIIDEAHLLDLDVLRKLRLLFDGFPKNHNLILFAQPDLLGRLAMNVYSDIKTRITYSAKLLPLEQDDMQKYIFREIGEAELPANIFDENAIGLITRSCEGNLRLCRNLCYASLVECAHLKQKSISIDIVNRVLIQPHWRKHSEDV